MNLNIPSIHPGQLRESDLQPEPAEAATDIGAETWPRIPRSRVAVHVLGWALLAWFAALGLLAAVCL